MLLHIPITGTPHSTLHYPRSLRVESSCEGSPARKPRFNMYTLRIYVDYWQVQYLSWHKSSHKSKYSVRWKYLTLIFNEYNYLCEECNNADCNECNVPGHLAV